ncbi:hypothetical protein J3A84_08980 [Proteiniclasticum sp. SCR006]|uniref:Uncharacterized protein n=1 Tax=Proteiniclasticum aestuarii TaxID=2817862 RepID=A0A939HB19_9CLOT|nr:hypothetical protein [Proteiniclasticum aestuarii]MBO1265158.1 hypothetical protein [Proteiniclasticum aestuarii]
MNDIVAVFGILLAVYTYIDSLYRNAINAILDEKGSPKAANNVSLRKKLKDERNYKATPLLIFSALVLLMMLPDTLRIISKSARGIFVDSSYVYSISSATIIFVFFVFIYWFIIDVKLILDINMKLENLSKDRG